MHRVQSLYSTWETLDKVTFSWLKHTTFPLHLLLFHEPLQAQQHCGQPGHVSSGHRSHPACQQVLLSLTGAQLCPTVLWSSPSYSISFTLQHTGSIPGIWDTPFPQPHCWAWFWHQEPAMSNPLPEVILESVFSVWKPSDQGAAAAKAVPQGDGHGPAAPSLPPPGSHHLPSCSSAASSPGPSYCTEWIFIVNF